MEEDEISHTGLNDLIFIGSDGKAYEAVDVASVGAIVDSELDGKELAERYTAELEKWLFDNKVKVGDVILLLREVQEEVQEEIDPTNN